MSKLVFKLTFKHPNFKNTKLKNVAHVHYIATRPGTDKSITEQDLKKELESEANENLIYAKYIDERPRSHGLFDDKGVADLKEVEEELKNYDGFVWRGIISIKEEIAKEIGYLKKEKWQDLLRAKMPELAKEMDISLSNFRWVGAVHMEKGHPHAHVMFWEKEPKRGIGIVNKKTLNRIRKHFADEVFAEERFNYLIEKNQMRDLIRDLAKDDVSKAAELAKEVLNESLELKALIPEMNIIGVPPKIYEKDEIILAQKIIELAEMLPGKGRVTLKYMPPEVKEKTLEIADYILKQPEFTASVAKNLKAVENLTRIYTGKEEAIQRAKDNAFNDLKTRVAQIVLKGAAEINREMQSSEGRNTSYTTQNTVHRIWKSAWRAVERERMRQETEVAVAQRRKALEEKVKAQEEEKNER